jgi:hypothetical protein
MRLTEGEKHSITKLLATILKIQFKYFKKEFEIDRKSLMNYQKVQ